MELLQKQAYDLINSLNEQTLKDTIEILQTIVRENEIKIYFPKLENSFGNEQIDGFYSNIPNTLLQGYQNHSVIGPDRQLTLFETTHYNDTNLILNDYVIDYGTKFNWDDSGHVLKNHDEVLFDDGDMVVYNDYIFYITYSGSVSSLYVTHDDFLNEINRFSIASRHLQKIILVKNLEEELKLCKEAHGPWNGY